ncbi:MAG: type II toxin-antitoxin system RelE/ParE family toxin [Deltaproteobacteria bacterium]|nr:type II toxin-antitoxin system RelE/ParE family toxin [Deltaproteobacteria bacterium]
MIYSLKIKGSAAKEIRRLSPEDRSRVVAAIDGLKEQPHLGTLLKGQLTGLRRLRVGCYRVIYEVQDDVLVVLVLRVGHRRDVYR